jgi:hypothetical protein
MPVCGCDRRLVPITALHSAIVALARLIGSVL